MTGWYYDEIRLKNAKKTMETIFNAMEKAKKNKKSSLSAKLIRQSLRPKPIYNKECVKHNDMTFGSVCILISISIGFDYEI